jgi:hypothetical protein
VTRKSFVLGSIALFLAASGSAHENRHHALPQVPQSADIAALNRESLAKTAPVSNGAKAADSQLAANTPAIKKAARKR